MTKTFTNGTIFMMAKALLDDNSFRKNPNIKTRMAVRQALKFNSQEIANKYNLINEMIQEITKEIQEEFVQAKKASMEEDAFKLNTGYETEYVNVVNYRLHELETQTIDMDIKTIPQKELDLYLERNDGEFTDLELDVLEIFVEETKEEVNE